MSRDLPILMSAPMVRATLSGTKTQTRRVLKQANGPSLSVGMDEAAPGVAELSWLYGDGPGHEVYEAIKRVRCPYGAPGDRLWVREAWRAPREFDDTKPRDLKAPADGLLGTPIVCEATRHESVRFGKLRPGMFMPRWASRITLEVTGVRVERLQDCSEADAIAEGVLSLGKQWAVDAFPDYFEALADARARGECPPIGPSPYTRYAALWDQINGPGSWNVNPWVWVVEFRKVTP